MKAQTTGALSKTMTLSLVFLHFAHLCVVYAHVCSSVYTHDDLCGGQRSFLSECSLTGVAFGLECLSQQSTVIYSSQPVPRLRSQIGTSIPGDPSSGLYACPASTLPAEHPIHSSF